MSDTTVAPTADIPRRPGAFDVPAEAYDRLIGRYLPTLAPAFAEAAGVGEGAHLRVLDVGCGPGGLTEELSRRVSPQAVAAIDPSALFVAACKTRNPEAEVSQGFAEHLPYEDGRFDATLSSLVVGFMSDPEAGAREMLRVTKRGGIIAACFWDFTHMPMLNAFWSATAAVEPSASAEMHRLGTDEGQIAELFSRVGAQDVTRGVLQATTEYADYDDLWGPIEEGIGQVGWYYQSLSPEQRNVVQRSTREILNPPSGRFSLTGRAWFACGKVAS
jgi:ubiquinone/menaquinone biosynthesis C-methylase UbiE